MPQVLSGEEALVTAARYAGALPLLGTEILMPGMGGFRLADLLTVSRPETQVLFISGHYDDSALVRQGPHQFQRSFLLKPFHQGELSRTIREVLERRGIASATPLPSFWPTQELRPSRCRAALCRTAFLGPGDFRPV